MTVYYKGTASEWVQIDGLYNIMSLGRTLYINNKPLTNAVLEDITEIKPYAFCYCTSLRSITIPDSVQRIGNDAFDGCPCVKTNKGLSYVDKWLIKADSAITSATIKEDTVGIADGAFADCSSLTSVVIPDSVTSIGNAAFSDCSSLTSVTFNGTKEEWNNVGKGDGWKVGVPTNCVVHCTDGDVAI